MADIKELDRKIHELVPVVQMFKSYSELASNPSVHIHPSVFKKCAMKLQEAITIVREVATNG